MQHYTPEYIIQTLKPYLSEKRMERIESVLSKRIRSVHVAIESPYDVHNGLAIVRTAEALGVSHMHFIQAEMKKGQGRATTRGTLKWTHLHSHETFSDFLENRGGFHLAGASVEGTMMLEELPVDRPLCLLFGNEHRGLSEEAKKRCDFLFSIPLYGMVESYNLSVSAAITLYDYLKRKRLALKQDGDLSEEEYLAEKAHYYVRSLGGETAQALLSKAQSSFRSLI